MKIIGMIKPLPPTISFINKINEKFKLDLVVLEVSPSDLSMKNILSKIKSKGFVLNLQLIKNLLSKKINKNKLIDDYNHYFEDKWDSVDEDIPVLVCDSVNSDLVHQRLKEEAPDLILDHGTSIVKDHIIETADLAFNLHWGLSPYYRGTQCTEWALINWDPYNIGVTIHKLMKIVDGGNILDQKRAVVTPESTVNSINMQLTALGTDSVIAILEKMAAGEELNYVEQDYSLGYSTTSKHWSHHLRDHIEYIEKNGIIEKMLKFPARKKKLPIVEL